ncbi:MAG: DUF6033 family protein [Eubacteriales bacterium]|nr:DUF6033 family protein [Eubacteriales bacterium]
MEISVINNYSDYKNHNIGEKQKDSIKTDKTTDGMSSSKTYNNAKDYKKYLKDNYDCFKDKNCTVAINDSFLEEAMNDEKKAQWLEYNLSILPAAIEKSRNIAEASGAKIMYHSVTINGYDSITSEMCTQTEVDPGIEKARKELQERLEKRRTEKKEEEKKAAEKAEEKRMEEMLAQEQAKKEAIEEMTTISATGTDIKDLTEKINLGIANSSTSHKGGSIVVGFDAKA